jgi:hypothetical protein
VHVPDSAYVLVYAFSPGPLFVQVINSPPPRSTAAASSTASAPSSASAPSTAAASSTTAPSCPGGTAGDHYMEETVFGRRVLVTLLDGTSGNAVVPTYCSAAVDAAKAAGTNLSDRLPCKIIAFGTHAKCKPVFTVTSPVFVALQLYHCQSCGCKFHFNAKVMSTAVVGAGQVPSFSFVSLGEVRAKCSQSGPKRKRFQSCYVTNMCIHTCMHVYST